ncbi:T-complex protein 1, epsilon subunit [Vittaforma corneae ATCC 50505]|uniref:T-complex protein 1, epsilon subunit n=1 Tax=Vittaforma corneae (strain ATCC 50505) TaxID=993615 RepID=L2GMG2_VITCO|nr:T-complex protein 1, epsilon subunit [Vittaforma corneae ATCC 50505]ELA41482.1 T-complex protein 1, epsilon subunit [Vittaforma corneae ATCC 50505]
MVGKQLRFNSTFQIYDDYIFVYSLSNSVQQVTFTNFTDYFAAKILSSMAQILTDELGQSFQLGKEEHATLRGRECLEANINTVKSIASFLSSSLGPTGMDKLLTDKDGNIYVTNDGATILKEMDMTDNPISQLILQLSQSQDDEIGDGTTSIVILTSAILSQAKFLLEKGMHPIKISEGLSTALKLAEKHLLKVSEEITDLNAQLLKVAKTSLGSKIVSLYDFSGLCVEASLAVADLSRKDIDLDLISVQSKTGKSLADTRLVKGLVIKKEFSHPQMSKCMKGARIALLSCPFEPPKLKNKNSLIVSNAEEYRSLELYEKMKFEEMITYLKNCKVDVVLCQWGFDDEANSLLMQNNIMAVRWVGGNDLGLIASHIRGSIVARFEDLREEYLGIADVKEESLGTENEKIITIESPGKNRAVTILVRGSTEYVIEEAKRAIRDALCAIRSMIDCERIVYGGGSCELSLSIYLDKKAKEFGCEDEAAIKAFSRALLDIPITLSQNSGFDAVEYVEKLRELHISNNEPCFGVDCLETGERNMKKLGIFETFKSKLRQLKMATDLVNTILKINDVISTKD